MSQSTSFSSTMDMSTSIERCTPQSVFGDYATPCRSSASSTPATVVSGLSPFAASQPRPAVSLSARTVADAHAALEALCRRAADRSAPHVAHDVSTDDDAWLPRSAGHAVDVSVFDSSVVPSISLGEYDIALTSRIPHVTAELTLATVVLCRRYISTLKTPPTPAIMHRLYATAYYIAMCSHCDFVVTPSDYANLAGLHAKEMPRLTSALLLAVDWRTQVTRDQLETLVAACDPLL